MTSGKYTPNRVKVFSNRAMICLNGKHNVSALVDLPDLPTLRQLTWVGDGNGYAVAGIRDGSRRRCVAMHRLLMGCSPGDGQLVDHVNRNKLDNRRCNLRLADKSLNAYNSTRSKHGPYAGTTWHQKSGRWRAFIRRNNKSVTVGSFVTRDDALAARVAAELDHFNELKPR